jgi:hypothetical protein
MPDSCSTWAAELLRPYQSWYADPGSPLYSAAISAIGPFPDCGSNVPELLGTELVLLPVPVHGALAHL